MRKVFISALCLFYSSFAIGQATTSGGRGDCEYDFEEVGGVAILEAESFNIEGTRWIRKNERADFTGTSYLEWTGGNFFNAPGNGVITAKIKINSPGKYRFIWRTTVGEGTNATEYNDSWIRLPDADDFYGEKPDGSRTYPKGEPRGRTPKPRGGGADGWFKSYVNNLNWSFQSVTGDAADGRPIFAEFNNPGIYTVELSGRSRHHLIDRIILAKRGGQNIATPETRCPDANPVPLPGEEAEVADCSGAPSNFMLIESTSTTATFSFDNTPENTRTFELRAFIEGRFTGSINVEGGADSFKSGNAGASTITIGRLVDGTTYDFVFRALCNPGGSPITVVRATIGSVTTPPEPTPTEIAVDNFELEAVGESCPDSNDGKISITAKDESLNYTAIITGPESFSKTENFSAATSLNELVPGKYNIEITIVGNIDFKQKVVLEVKERLSLPTVSEKVLNKQLTLSLSEGFPYQINLNGQIFTTTSSQFTLNLINGENNLIVKTDKDCQGIHSSKITVNSNTFSVYPNPVVSNLNIVLENPEEIITVNVYDVSGRIVKHFTKSGITPVITADVSNLEDGIHFVSVKGKNTSKNAKIIKK